jgi:hypothetical protein
MTNLYTRTHRDGQAGYAHGSESTRALIRNLLQIFPVHFNDESGELLAKNALKWELVCEDKNGGPTQGRLNLTDHRV